MERGQAQHQTSTFCDFPPPCLSREANKSLLMYRQQSAAREAAGNKGEIGSGGWGALEGLFWLLRNISSLESPSSCVLGCEFGIRNLGVTVGGNGPMWHSL